MFHLRSSFLHLLGIRWVHPMPPKTAEHVPAVLAHANSTPGLKVLIFSLQPRGGFHHYTAELCNALVQHAEIASVRYLIAYREQRMFGVGNEEDDLVYPVVQIGYLSPQGQLAPLRKYLRLLRNFMREMRSIWQGAYDVFHMQTGTHSHLLNLALLIWCKIACVSIVRTVHEINMDERGKGVGWLGRLFSMLELQLANHVIVHDTAMRDRLHQESGRQAGRISVIPHGNYLGFRRYIPTEIDKDAAVLCPALYQRQGENPCSAREHELPLILFFGIWRFKGLEVFLQAWRMVQAEGHACEALLAGTVHPTGVDLLEEAQQLPGIKVDARYIPNSELWRYFLRSTFVVMPYLVGTTSGAIHLAYAFKRPVIVSDLDCFKEMVVPGRTGLVVPRNDATALKEAIVRLCRDRELCRHMGEEGFRLESSAHYRWDTIADMTVTVYRTICKVPNRAPI